MKAREWPAILVPVWFLMVVDQIINIPDGENMDLGFIIFISMVLGIVLLLCMMFFSERGTFDFHPYISVEKKSNKVRFALNFRNRTGTNALIEGYEIEGFKNGMPIENLDVGKKNLIKMIKYPELFSVGVWDTHEMELAEPEKFGINSKGLYTYKVKIYMVSDGEEIKKYGITELDWQGDKTS